MKLKPITCPQCGKLLCKAKIGSEVELHCHTCKTLVKGTVDQAGGVYSLPLATTSKTSIGK